MKNILKIIFAFIIIFFYQVKSFGHELWLEPKKFHLQTNEKLEVHIKVGQNFNGDNFPYISKETAKLNLFFDKKKIILKHRDGDYPAIQANVAQKGAYILTYESAPEILEYNNFEKFKLFLQEQGLWNKHIFVQTDNIIESYTRFAKSIIRVGDSNGSDFKSDLIFELVLQDPIEKLKINSIIRVKLFYQDQPYKNSQITIFRTRQNKLDTYKVITNNNGEALVPTKDGGVFLLSAVKILKNNQKQNKAEWNSLWASVTFEVK